MTNKINPIGVVLFLVAVAALLYWGWEGVEQVWNYLQHNIPETLRFGAVIALICTYWLSRAIRKAGEKSGQQHLAVERSRLFNECLLYLSNLRQLADAPAPRKEWEIKLAQFKPFFSLHAGPNSIRLLQRWERLGEENGYCATATDAALSTLVKSLRQDLGASNVSLLDEDLMPLLDVKHLTTVPKTAQNSLAQNPL